MILDEAIAHAKEKAKELRIEAIEGRSMYPQKHKAECLECAKEHEQLASWLEELAEWRKLRLICANEGVFVYKVKEDKESEDK